MESDPRWAVEGVKGGLRRAARVLLSLAAGIRNAARQVGASFGVALRGTLMQTLGDPGLLVSFAIVLLLYAAMTVLVFRLIPAPRSRLAVIEAGP